MLYLIGIGLGDEKDITLRGLEVLKSCSTVYFENYTSIYNGDFNKLEELIGKKIAFAGRKLIEVNPQEILEKAKSENCAILIMGDVFSATTHGDLITRARELGIEVGIIHNASILTAVGDTGLSLYKFGKVSSIPFLTAEWKVESPYDALKENKGMHTLFLLDLKPAEKKTMTFNEAIEFLLKIEERRKEGFFTADTLVVGCAALGSKHGEIYYGKASLILKKKSSSFPQCLIVPGKLHFMEEEILEQFKLE